MTSASLDGIITLAVIVLIGPLFYFGKALWRRFRGHPTAALQETSVGKDGREEYHSKAYIFALVGWAIGIGNVWRFPYVISVRCWFLDGAFLARFRVSQCVFLPSFSAK